MDRNLLLAFALSFAVLMLWTTLVEPPPAPAPGTAEPSAPSSESSEPPAPVEPPAALPEPSPAPGPQPEPVPGEVAVSEPIAFETSLYRAVLDTRGAAITHWELKEFRTSRREGSEPLVLTTGDPPYDRLLATPFTEFGLGDLSNAHFELERRSATTFVFGYTQDGVKIRKQYEFREGGYDFELSVSVENASNRELAPRFAVMWPAAQRPGNDFREQSLATLYDGSVKTEMLRGIGKSGIFGGAEREIDFEEGPVDWVGAQTTFFIGAALPDDPSQSRAQFVAVRPGEAGLAALYFDATRLPPGQRAERVIRAYIGPKEPERLEALRGGLIQSIDLGWSWVVPLTRFFNWLLAVLHGFIPNYGIAIIVLTVLVRLVTAPLTNRQMRSMERMRQLSPKVQELKEKYGDDRQKQSEEMMRLYRQEGVNPLGGCLPMVLQLPVFIGLFYALRSSIRLRQAPFFGWIDDLSAPDMLTELPVIGIPLRVLPLVMGATMLVQQRITPMQQMDPAQQKMMMTVMPIVMTVVFYQFPSGLVLYWMVSNVLAIANQLWIGRHLRK